MTANPSNLIRVMPAEGAEMRCAAKRTLPRCPNCPPSPADILERIRARRPRVHCITNAVAQNFTANVLLAAGAVPSMTVAPEEVGAFVARADALLVNLGTFDRERREAARSRRSRDADEQACPGCSIRCSSTARRRAPALPELAGAKPAAVRLNAAEFAALAGGSDRRGGAGGTMRSEQALRGRADRRDRSGDATARGSRASPTAIR